MKNKEKYELIKELSFYLLLNSETLEELKESQKTLKSCKFFTNDQIKELIQLQEINYYLPF